MFCQFAIMMLIILIATIMAIDNVNSKVFNRNRNTICKQKWFDICEKNKDV